MVEGKVYHALLNEAQFTCEMLCTGVTQIRRANYAKKGVYFQAFTSLSTGIERIGKLCLILDFMIANKGKCPDKEYFKKTIGHDIGKIYNEALRIKEEHNFGFSFLQDLNSKIHQAILSILSRFGKGDRYSNIDLAADERNYDDPIKVWYEKVDIYLFDNMVTKRIKEKIRTNAAMVGQMMESFSVVRHTGEDESEISSVEEGSYRTGMFEAVGPYRQLYTFHILRFFVELIDCLEYKIQKENEFEIPIFSEIFARFMNNDKYVKSRKTWEKL